MTAGYCDLGFCRTLALAVPSTVVMVTHDVSLTSSRLDWPATHRKVAACFCRALGITGNRWLYESEIARLNLV